MLTWKQNKINERTIGCLSCELDSAETAKWSSLWNDEI